MPKLIQQINYQTLKRSQVDGKRLYETPTGDRVASVTTILDKTKSEESKKALREWRNRVGHDQAQAITTEAANRGTRMHKYLEDFVKTGSMPKRGTNPYSWASHDMAAEIINKGLAQVGDVWGVEVPLFFPKIYAGTTDCIGLHNDSLAILDFKQSNKVKKDEWVEDYKLQLVAYAEAHNEVYGTNINKGVIMMCVKPVEDANSMGKYITPPAYQEWVLENSEFDEYRKKWWQRVETYYSTCI